MKSKKITVIISYDYEDKNTVSNDRIADRVKNDLLKGSNPNHEKIESVTVEDNGIDMNQFNKGWWNCFLSYTDELAQIQRDFDVTANAQLKAAGVEKKEIEGVLKTEMMSDKTRELLTEYKDNLK